MKECLKLERLLHEKNALREFIQSQNVFVNLPTAGFPASSECCRCADVYSAISLTLAIKRQNKSGNHEKKNYTHVAIQVQAFLRKPKKLTNTKIFSSNKKLKA